MSLEAPKKTSEEEAHEEANILRAHAESKGKIYKHEATAEDYDEALRTLEELRQLAEEEKSTSMKVLDKLNQLVQLPGLGASYVARLGEAIMGTGPGGPIERWKESKTWTTDVVLEQMFGDAKSRLQRMKNAGKKLGEKESWQAD